MTAVPRTALQVRSLLKTNGELELSLVEFEVPQPADGKVLVRVEAAPIGALVRAGRHAALSRAARLYTFRQESA